MQKFQLLTEVTEYATAYDQTNAPESILVVGSQNTMIDGRNGKVRSRPGYTRIGSANTDLAEVRNGFDWHTSKGTDQSFRFYGGEWEFLLGTVDDVIVNSYVRFATGMSDTAIVRGAPVYDATEGIDIMIFVQADSSLYEWNGATAVVDSIPDGTHVKKAGSTTWAENRFYTSRNKVMTCLRTSVDYTYTSGESGDTLVVTDSSGLVAGDILVQKIVTTTDTPTSNRNNYTIGVFENQIFVGSEEDEAVYISTDTDYTDFTPSPPRTAGDAGLLTLTDPVRGFGILAGNMVVFCGPSSAFKVIYREIAVGTTLTESLTALPLKIGVNQGAFNQETIVPVGNALMYLSNEPCLRMLETVAQADEPQLKTLSNPIKPDFDAEDFTNACAIWYKNAYFLSAPANSHMYILESIENASGRVRRFWQPPQIVPFRAFSIINGSLAGHSNSVPETYKLFDGLSDTASDDSKLPINAIAIGAYRSFGDRANMKNFDEYYIEGEIIASTDSLLDLNYDFGGHTQAIQRIIDGTDEDILEETVGVSSLAQESLATDSLAGLLNAPVDAKKFRVIFEIAKEDFNEMNWKVSTNETDQYWSVLSQGPNATLSPRKNTVIHR